MAGWGDSSDYISDKSAGPLASPETENIAFSKPKQVDAAADITDNQDTCGFDVDDSFDRGRNENEKENGYPIRQAGPKRSTTGGRRGLPPPSSAPPPRSAPIMSESMMAKVREKSALRVSQEKAKGGGNEDTSGYSDGKDGEYHTDDDLEELLREEEDNDIIRHPSVNISDFRSGDDSDDSVEGSDIDGEADERILGEDSGVDPMPSTQDPKRDNRLSYALVAHESGESTVRVQCTVLRDRYSLGSRLYPQYQLILDDTNRAILLARKQSMNKKSNYHIFDLSRGAASVHPNQKYNKKSGNYLGKLRASNIESSDYVLLTRSSEKSEVAAISYERSSMLKQFRDGSQPRRLYVVLPHLDADSVPVPNIVKSVEGSVGNPSISDCVKDPVECQQRQLYSLSSKEPTYENGNYRLNFYGRVSHPSVKNFQLVSQDNPNDIICQFGKVGEDKFHLDFKAPMSPFQAFGIALTQFNI